MVLKLGLVCARVQEENLELKHRVQSLGDRGEERERDRSAKEEEWANKLEGVEERVKLLQ